MTDAHTMSNRNRVVAALTAHPEGLTPRQIADITGLAVNAAGSSLSKMFCYGEATRHGASGKRVYVMTPKAAGRV